MSRLETRIERLEAALQGTAEVPNAVVRYNPGAATGWLPGMIAQLGWPASQYALVVIDANGEVDAAPEVIVPPVLDSQATAEQAAVLARAGHGAGLWWIAVTARGWADAVPMYEGMAALIADLRRQRLRMEYGTHGEL